MEEGININYTNTKKRFEQIDIATGIVILLVVIGHLVPFNGYVFRLIFSFHMPYFFLKSGYFSKRKVFEGDIIKFVEHRIKKLLIPSLVMNCLVLILGIATVSSFWEAIYFIFVSPNHEWFVMALFFVQLIAFIYFRVIYYMNDKRMEQVCTIFIVMLIPFLASFSLEKGIHDAKYIPFKVGSVLLGLLFFFIGYAMREWFDLNQIKNSWRITKQARFVYVIAICVICALTYNNTYVNVANCYWGRSDMYFILTSVFWSATVVVIAFKLLKKQCCKKLCSFLEICGRNSLIIYFGQSLLFSVFNKCLFVWTGIQYTPMIDLPWYLCIAYFILTVAILVPICVVKEKRKGKIK